MPVVPVPNTKPEKSGGVGRFEEVGNGEVRHEAVIAGALEAQRPLNRNSPVRAGVGAGSAVLEESPSGSRHSPSPGSPGPIGPGQRCLASPSWSATRGLPKNTSRCLAQLCRQSKARKPGEMLFPGVPVADGGRNPLDPPALWGKARRV